MKTPFEPIHRFILDQDGDAAGGAGGGDTVAGADTTVDTPGAAVDKPLSLRESLDANMEIAEKGDQASDLSEAARRLAGARRAKATDGKAPPAKAAAQAAPNALEADAKAKRAAELAAMAPEARAKAEAEEKAKAEAGATEAPAHWSPADREMFAKQTPEAKQWLLSRHKAMEADYTKKTQELATTRRMKETLDDVFKPYREQMALSGVTEEQAIRQLVASHDFLQRDPLNAVKHLAQQYGFDLKALTEGAAAADPAGESPTVQALRKQVETLTGKLTEFTGAQSQQQMNARMNEVTQFAEEKDDQGQLKRPYFDEVARDVVIRIRAAREEGKPISLQDAYESAVYANPQTRTKVLAAENAQRIAKEEAERKAKTDAARKAGFDVKGEGAAAPMAPGNSTLRDSLEKAWDAGEGRV